MGSCHGYWMIPLQFGLQLGATVLLASITIVIVIVQHIISFDHNCEKLSWILDDSTDVGTSHSGSPLLT